MKHLIAILMVSVVVHAADALAEPKVIAVPFEPPVQDFFKMDDKFAHPPELIGLASFFLSNFAGVEDQ